MTTRQLHDLLRDLRDTHEIVVQRPPAGDVLKAVWRSAEDEARAAYRTWCEQGGETACAAYRAAADRADAALEALRLQS